MTALSDTLTVGLVLVLLFGSIALYLYTRIQQSEQKITLLEHILLDLKMSAEIKSYSELPAETPKNISSDSYQPFIEEDNDEDIAPGVTIKAYSPASSVSKHSLQEEEIKSDIIDYSEVIQNAINNTASDNILNDSDDKKEVSDQKVSVNYESMTLKDLQSMAKQRGITSASTMKKAQIIEALKTSDRATSIIAEPIEPGSLGSSSFLETSTFLEKSSE